MKHTFIFVFIYVKNVFQCATKTLTVVMSKEDYTLEKYLELFDIEVHDVCC